MKKKQGYWTPYTLCPILGTVRNQAGETMNGYFRTGKRLQIAIDNMDRIEGFEEMLDAFFYDLYELDPEGPVDCPWWLGETPASQRWNGRTLPVRRDRWDEGGPELTDDILDDCQWFTQYVPGFIERYDYGQLIEVNGEHYVYIGSESLPEEQEHQADDGGLAYEYRCYSFVRVLAKLTDLPELHFNYLTK